MALNAYEGACVACGRRLAPQKGYLTAAASEAYYESVGLDAPTSRYVVSCGPTAAKTECVARRERTAARRAAAPKVVGHKVVCHEPGCTHGGFGVALDEATTWMCFEHGVRS